MPNRNKNNKQESNSSSLNWRHDKKVSNASTSSQTDDAPMKTSTKDTESNKNLQCQFCDKSFHLENSRQYHLNFFHRDLVAKPSNVTWFPLAGQSSHGTPKKETLARTAKATGFTRAFSIRSSASVNSVPGRTLAITHL